jgi:hypothetical protein
MRLTGFTDYAAHADLTGVATGTAVDDPRHHDLATPRQKLAALLLDVIPGGEA